MPLSYGDISFAEPVETVSLSQEPIYDQANNYSMHKVRLHVRVTYNPMATSVKLNGAIGAQTVTQIGGQFAATTTQALEEYLSVPRRKLIYSRSDANNASVDLVYSPPKTVANVDLDCDPTGGPFPVHVRVTPNNGNKTWTVELIFETTVTRRDRFTTTPPTLLSHTFEETQSILGADLRTVRQIRGRLVLDLGLLRNGGLQPDAFRKFILPVPPFKFRRVNVEVTAAENGYEYFYTCADIEERISVKREGITRVKCFVDKGVTNPSLIDMGVNIVGGITSAATGNGGLSGAVNLGSTITSSMPRRFLKVVVFVQGSPTGRFSVIQDVAYRAMVYQLSKLNSGPTAIGVGGGPPAPAAPGGAASEFIAWANNWTGGTGGRDTLLYHIARSLEGHPTNFGNVPGTAGSGITESRDEDAGTLTLTVTLSASAAGSAFNIADVNATRIINEALNNDLDYISPEDATYDWVPPTPGAMMPQFDNGTRHGLGLTQAVSQTLQAALLAPYAFGTVSGTFPNPAGTGGRAVRPTTTDPHTPT